MKDSLLTEKNKRDILKFIKEKNYADMLTVLENKKTGHAGTAKTKDKRFVITEIVSHIIDTSVNPERDYFAAGSFFCKRNEEAAKEIGVMLIWRAYKFNTEKTESILLKIADDANWEVREYAGTAFANTIFHNKEFYDTLMKWTKHNSENVRRAVVFSAIGLRDKKNLVKAFALFEPLLFDDSKYVRKNLGPFILGSYFANKFPVETVKQINKWSKIRDENVRWNIAMSFNNSFGNRNPELALDVLKNLTGDQNIIVRRAVISTLRFLSKKHKKLVDGFIKKYSLKIFKEAD
ncbi:MAG: HEAT repeat domain-containing protein [Bacteroidetes bacterium]|nr:HEAT repeat domain-containing protein [Bacteroidota bacterium]